MNNRKVIPPSIPPRTPTLIIIIIQSSAGLFQLTVGQYSAISTPPVVVFLLNCQNVLSTIYCFVLLLEITYSPRCIIVRHYLRTVRAVVALRLVPLLGFFFASLDPSSYSTLQQQQQR